MAYKFQLGSARLSGSIVQEGQIKAVGNADDVGDISGSAELEIVGAARFGSTVAASGSITAGSSFIIGSADLNEADMEKIDGITDGTAAANKALVLDSNKLITGITTLTASYISASSIQATHGTFSANSLIVGSTTISETEIALLDGLTVGTVAASKAVTVDANKDVSGFRNVTATGAFIIGSANLNEADMELIDGLTAGTVAASKAVTVDSDSDVSGFRNVTATGAFIIGSANLNEADMEQIDGITAGTVAASKAIVVDANKDFSGHRNMSGSGVLQNVGNAIFGGALDVSGAVKLDGVSDTALDVAADSFYYRDNGDGTMKRDTMADYATAIAGDGLAAASGVLKLDFNELTAGTSDYSEDSLVFIDHNGGSPLSKKITYSNFVAGIAGDGLVNDGGRMAIQVDDSGIELDSDALRLKDNGVTLAKMAGLAAAKFILGDSNGDPAAVTMSGDATLANNGALSMAAAQTNITSLLASAIKIGEDDQTKIDFGTANEIKFYANNNQEMVIDDNGVVIAGNLTVQGTTTSVNSTTINISSSFTFEGPADDHETVLSCGSPTADATLELFQGAAGTYYMPVLADTNAKSTVIAATIAEINLLDGGNSRSAVTLADGDGFILNDNGTMKQATMGSIKTYIGGTTNVALKDDTEELAVGFNYFADLAGAEAANLPASPEIGQVVQLKAPSNCSVSNTLTVNRQGSHTIDGETSIVLESPNAAVSFVYVASNVWKIY